VSFRPEWAYIVRPCIKKKNKKERGKERKEAEAEEINLTSFFFPNTGMLELSFSSLTFTASHKYFVFSFTCNLKYFLFSSLIHGLFGNL
jgi:hypothetical protein